MKELPSQISSLLALRTFGLAVGILGHLGIVIAQREVSRIAFVDDDRPDWDCAPMRKSSDNPDSSERLSGRKSTPIKLTTIKLDASVDVIAERLDQIPLNHLHLLIVTACTIGLAVDIAEVAISNVLAAIFSTSPHSVTRTDLSILLASVFAGGALGAPVFGELADRFGRRQAILGALILMTLGSLAAAASRDLTDLTIARFVSGFAIGSYPPLAAAYLSDVMPPARRGAMLLVCTGLGFLGAPAVIQFTRWLTPAPPLGVDAWRWSLGVMGLVAAVASVLLALLPESPRWLAAIGRGQEAAAACHRFEAASGLTAANLSMVGRREAVDGRASLPVRLGLQTFFSDMRQLRRTAFFIVLYVLSPWATTGFPLLSAAVLIEKGFRLDQSLVFAALSTAGPLFGTVLAALVVDRIGRRTCLVPLAGMMICAGVLFSASLSFDILVFTGLAFNTVAATYAGVLSIYSTELMPTAQRASSQSYVWAIGRVTAAFVPFVLLSMLAYAGVVGMFIVINATLAISIVVLLFGPSGRSGKSVM